MRLNPFRMLGRNTTTPKQRYGGKIVHSERDQYGLIQVVDTSVCRSLHFESAVKQSRYFFNAPMTLAFEYQQMLEQCLNEFSYRHSPTKLLMLGVGGGSLASKIFLSQPKLHMTLVDIRQSVLDIAHEYFHLPVDDRIQTHCYDASEFVHDFDDRYDVIVIDLYDSYGMPPVFSELPFLDALMAQLNAPGLVLFNLWQSTPESTLKIIEYFEQRERGQLELFPINTSENLILQYQKT